MSRKGRTLLILFAFVLIVFALLGGFARFYPTPVIVERPVHTPGPLTTITARMVTSNPTPTEEVTPTSEPSPVLVAAPRGSLVVHFLSVGTGDAVLIETPRGGTVLVDAGPSDRGDEVVRYLRSMGVPKLDLLIASHAHIEQIGGAPAVIAGLDGIGHYLDAGAPSGHPVAYETLVVALTEAGVNRSVLRSGQRIALDPEVWLDVLNPASSVSGDQHEDSLVLRLEYGRNAILLTGGLGAESAARLLESGERLSADVLQIPRQGEAGAASPALLERVRPRIAVVSNGEIRTGEVDSRMLSNLLTLGASVYLTNSSGTVAVACDGELCRPVRGGTRAIHWPADQDQATYAPTPTPYVLEPPYRSPFTIGPTVTTPVPSPTVPHGAIRVTGLDLVSQRVLLANEGSTPVNLTDWKLSDSDASHRYRFPAYTLYPGGLVMVQVGKGTDGRGVLYWDATGVFEPGGDTAYLHDADGHLVDYTDGGSSVTIPTPTPTFAATATVTSPGTLSTVVIEELALDDEWVRLKNNGDEAVNLSGWRLTDDGPIHTYDFGAVSILPGRAITIFSARVGTDTEAELFWSETPVWNNEGDTAHLFDATGRERSTLVRP
jgi:competence protein ComEC